MGSNSQILCLIVDVDPATWLEYTKDTVNRVLEFCESISTFCALFKAISPDNHLQAFISGPTISQRAVPVKCDSSFQSQETDTSLAVCLQKKLEVSMRDLFSMVLSSLDQETCNIKRGTKLSGALSSALCYINKCKKSASGGLNAVARILVIKISHDERGQHTNLMNIFFTALKQNVIIDSYVVGRSSSFMEKGCDISRGMHFRRDNMDGMLEFLTWMYVPSIEMRNELMLPMETDVELGPECFCHHNIVNVGWVCSVCLSIFCQFSPICLTCQTAFKFMPVMTKPKKKKQKI